MEESYQQEARERFSLSKELERLQQLNLRLGEEATNLTRALKGQKTQATGANWCWSGCSSMRAWKKAGNTRPRSA